MFSTAVLDRLIKERVKISVREQSELADLLLRLCSGDSSGDQFVDWALFHFGNSYSRNAQVASAIARAAVPGAWALLYLTEPERYGHPSLAVEEVPVNVHRVYVGAVSSFGVEKEYEEGSLTGADLVVRLSPARVIVGNYNGHIAIDEVVKGQTLPVLRPEFFRLQEFFESDQPLPLHPTGLDYLALGHDAVADTLIGWGANRAVRDVKSFDDLEMFLTNIN